MNFYISINLCAFPLENCFKVRNMYTFPFIFPLLQSEYLNDMISLFHSDKALTINALQSGIKSVHLLKRVT